MITIKDLSVRNAISIKFFKKRWLQNYKKFCVKKIGHALIYYKSDPFSFLYDSNNFSPTNNWEVKEMAKIFNKLGFWVDIIDRDIGENYKPVDKYDIFISNASGDSGKFYYKYASILKKAIKIFYATSMEKSVRKKLIEKRYDYFFQRHPEAKNKILYRRISKIDNDKTFEVTDAIFVQGSEKCIDTYKKFNKDIYKTNASTNPKIHLDISQIAKRDPKKFLYFGGNGNIVKGLDLAVEVFSDLPDLHLYICAPKTEVDFNIFFEKKIQANKNIHFVGFIPTNGKVFDKLTSLCSFVLLLSSTEGNATSIATCIRKGLIPIITPESGFEELTSSIIINDINLKSLKKTFTQAASMSRDELLQRSLNSYIFSFNYTRAKFSETFEKSIVKVLNKNKNRFNLLK